MHRPTKQRFHMGCGEPLSGGLRRLNELVRQATAQAPGKPPSRFPNGGRTGR